MDPETPPPESEPQVEKPKKRQWKRQCLGASHNGLRCQKPPLKDSDYCLYHTDAPLVRCTGLTASGFPCRKLPIQGSTMCEFHVGRAPLSINAARHRLALLIPRALEALDNAMEMGDWPVVVKAAQIILDRAGLGPKAVLTIDQRDRDLTSLSPEELELRAKRVYAALREAQMAARERADAAAQSPIGLLEAAFETNDKGSVS